MLKTVATDVGLSCSQQSDRLCCAFSKIKLCKFISYKDLGSLSFGLIP